VEPLIILVQLYFWYYLSTQVLCGYPGPGGDLDGGLCSELRNVSLELRNVSLELRNVSLELRNVSIPWARNTGSRVATASAAIWNRLTGFHPAPCSREQSEPYRTPVLQSPLQADGTTSLH
jgi:hypothetical protein